MKIISELYKNIKHQKLIDSQFVSEDGKENILFVDPMMINFDLYTMLMPYYLLETTEVYKTAVSGLSRYSEIDDKPPINLTISQIKWADVIVFPMTLDDFAGENELFSELRSINPKVKIIQTVLFDFYEIGNDHYLFNIPEQLSPEKQKELKQQMITRFESNFHGADRLLTLNPHLVEKLTKKGYKDVKYVPVLVDEATFKENIDYSKSLGIKNTPGIIFVSCELNPETRPSFKSYLPIFRALKEKHKLQFRLVVIGEDPEQHFPKIGFEYDHVDKGSIVHQFKAIIEASADFHLILNKKNAYSKNSESLYGFVERGLFGTPVATMSVSPLNKLIKNNKNGFVFNKRDDLKELVNKLIEDNSELIRISQALKEEITRHFQADAEKIKQLGAVYFENYQQTKPEEE